RYRREGPTCRRGDGGRRGPRTAGLCPPPPAADRVPCAASPARTEGGAGLAHDDDRRGARRRGARCGACPPARRRPGERDVARACEGAARGERVAHGTIRSPLVPAKERGPALPPGLFSCALLPGSVTERVLEPHDRHTADRGHAREAPVVLVQQVRDRELDRGPTEAGDLVRGRQVEQRV